MQSNYFKLQCKHLATNLATNLATIIIYIQVPKLAQTINNTILYCQGYVAIIEIIRDSVISYKEQSHKYQNKLYGGMIRHINRNK